MKKNVSGQIVGCQGITASNGTAFTGAVTVYVTGNGGTQAVGSVGAGACAHEGNGFHTYAPAQAETNYDHVAFTFIGTGMVPVTVQIFTSDDVSRIKEITDRLGTTLEAAAGSPNEWRFSLDALRHVPGMVWGAERVNFAAAGSFGERISANVTHAAGTAWNSGAVTSASFAAGAINAAVFAADAITAAKLAADVTTELQAGLATAAALATVQGFIDTEVSAIKEVTDRLNTTLEAASGSPNEWRFSLDALRNIPGLVWNAERTSYVTAGSFGQYVTANVTLFGGVAGAFAAGRPEVNASHAAGTAWNSGAITSATFVAGAINAAAIAADAITDAKVASDVTIASVTGAVGSVTGSVASVTGNVGGNVTGSVGSVATGGITAGSFAAGAIDAAAIAADAIGASELAASAVAEIQAGLATAASLSLVAVNVNDIEAVTVKLDTTLQVAAGSPGDYEFSADALRRAPAGGSGGATAAAIADAVWDEARSDHVAAGSFGEALDATVSSRASQSSITTLTGYVDTEVAQILSGVGSLLTLIEPAAGSPNDYRLSVDSLRHVLSAIPSVGSVADAVWDEARAGHLTTGTFGAAVTDTDLRGSRTVIRGTVSAGASTTSIPTSAFSPAGASVDQFKGRIVVFDNDTATAALRGEATDITASTNAATPTLTVTALSATPAAGDAFSVV